MVLQAAVTGTDTRAQRLRGRHADAARAIAPSPESGPRLPLAVADRLASLMAGDPGLAEAVRAHLPAARLASALDLGPYGAHSGRLNGAVRVDLTG